MMRPPSRARPRAGGTPRPPPAAASRPSGARTKRRVAVLGIAWSTAERTRATMRSCWSVATSWRPTAASPRAPSYAGRTKASATRTRRRAPRRERRPTLPVLPEQAGSEEDAGPSEVRHVRVEDRRVGGGLVEKALVERPDHQRRCVAGHAPAGEAVRLREEQGHVEHRRRH